MVYLVSDLPIATTIVGVITAVSTVFTALALVITAIAGLIRSRRVEGKVDDVHTIVNQQRTDMQNYQRALVGALLKHGIEVPVDQSVPPVPETPEPPNPRRGSGQAAL